jgi:hypothetical protein
MIYPSSNQSRACCCFEQTTDIRCNLVGNKYKNLDFRSSSLLLSGRRVDSEQDVPVENMLLVCKICHHSRQRQDISQRPYYWQYYTFNQYHHHLLFVALLHLSPPDRRLSWDAVLTSLWIRSFLISSFYLTSYFNESRLSKSLNNIHNNSEEVQFVSIGIWSPWLIMVRVSGGLLPLNTWRLKGENRPMDRW